MPGIFWKANRLRPGSSGCFTSLHFGSSIDSISAVTVGSDLWVTVSAPLLQSLPGWLDEFFLSALFAAGFIILVVLCTRANIGWPCA